jgi:hypothetical protein
VVQWRPMQWRPSGLALALALALTQLGFIAGCKTGRPVQRAASSPTARNACVAESIGDLSLEVSTRPDCAAAAGFRCSDACAAGDAVSCYLRAGGLEGVDATADETAALYRRACELGLAIGCTNHAAHLWRFGGAAEVGCAQRVFQKTCAADEYWGCGMFGRLLIDDQNASPADVARGRKVLQDSCERLGNFPCRVLALELESGKLGASDPATIARLLARACATGDKRSCGQPKRAADAFD